MARKTAIIKIPHEGRDKGKEYHIEEMPAWHMAMWARKVLQLCAASGIDLPKEVWADAWSSGVIGLAGIGARGLIAGLSHASDADTVELIDELWKCIKKQVVGQMEVTDSYLLKMSIEEPITILYLLEEVLSLHVGFSIRGRMSKFLAWASDLVEQGKNTLNTLISKEISPTS